MVDLVEVSTGDLITASRANLIKDYIQDGTHLVNTLSVNIGGIEIIDSSGNITTNIGTVDGINIATDVAANTSKITNATHSGDVIGNTVLTIADNVVTLTKMAHGTDGNLITYDSTGAPAYVTTGTTNQVLTSNGAGTAPTFQEASGGGGLYGVNVETLSSDKTLIANTNKIYQFLNPGNSTKIITLDTASASIGDRWIIKNQTTSYAISLYLHIKQGETTLDYCFSGSIKSYIFDGINWIYNNNGTGDTTDLDYNVSIGLQSNASNNGIAFGRSASASTNGTAIGYNCNGTNNGVAIGNNANGTTYGMALGRGSNGSSYGTSIGYFSLGDNYGTGIGYRADGRNYGVALGYYAKSNSKYDAVALGRYSETERYAEIAHNINGSDTDQENNITIGGWERTTTDATPVEIWCGGTTNQRFTIRASSVLSFKLQVTGKDNTTGDCAIYHFKGGIKRDGAGNTILLTTTKDVIHEDDANWDVAVTADDTNEALIITVTGDATNTVQWAARLDGVETHF